MFWLSFARVGEIPLQVAACGGPGAMDLAPGIEGLPLSERVQRVQRAWQNAVPRLLVFDNCEEEALLEAWRPPSGGCRVLVTSRRAHWSPTLGVIVLPLDRLPRADSMELLLRYRPDLASDATGLAAIAEELGDLPLAIHQAGSYLYDNVSRVLGGWFTDAPIAKEVRGVTAALPGLKDAVPQATDPQYLGRTGHVYLIRNDLEKVLRLVGTAKRPLVLFVDDLDRCAPSVVLETLEAINLFLAGEFPNCVFVLGIEPKILAAQIDLAYRDLMERLHARSPGSEHVDLGWRFLEKFVQLSVSMPRPGSQLVERFLDHHIGKPDSSESEPSEPDTADVEEVAQVIERRGSTIAEQANVARDLASSSAVSDETAAAATAAVSARAYARAGRPASSRMVASSASATASCRPGFT